MDRFTTWLQFDAIRSNLETLRRRTAFKHQYEDLPPEESAVINAALYDIITTSGEATGLPPSLEKIKIMKEAIGDKPLALASGITPDNIKDFVPYVTHFLVSTGISKNFDTFDPVLIKELIKNIN